MVDIVLQRESNLIRGVISVAILGWAFLIDRMRACETVESRLEARCVIFTLEHDFLLIPRGFYLAKRGDALWVRARRASSISGSLSQTRNHTS